MARLAAASSVVYLRATFDTIEYRVSLAPERGIASDGDQTLRDLYEERVPLIRALCGIVVGLRRGLSRGDRSEHCGAHDVNRLRSFKRVPDATHAPPDPPFLKSITWSTRMACHCREARPVPVSAKKLSGGTCLYTSKLTGALSFFCYVRYISSDQNNACDWMHRCADGANQQGVLVFCSESSGGGLWVREIQNG